MSNTGTSNNYYIIIIPGTYYYSYSDRVQEKWYKVLLSVGSFFLTGAMADGTIKSQNLQRVSIVQLMNFTYSIGTEMLLILLY